MHRLSCFERARWRACEGNENSVTIFQHIYIVSTLDTNDVIQYLVLTNQRGVSTNRDVLGDISHSSPHQAPFNVHLVVV